MAEGFNSLYRKYRPNSFKDVAGNKNVVEILETELKNDNFSHAYLFAGQRGTGKTSVARILAKGINCLDLQDGDPCNKCANCVAFNNGTFADIYEIDAASNNGVDEIRNIKNNVQTLPIVGKYKIYIIDEVHMLTKGAFNALLKTLEEPPAHVVFILATTEYDKIPATIISRCQSFSFKKISNKDMKARLNYIASNEGFKLDDDAANEIYDISEGSLRDALNVLEQLMVVCDQTKEIKVEDIKKIFYVATKKEKIQILKDILNKQSQTVINYFEQAKRQGMDFNVFTLSLIKMIKEIIEYKLTGEDKFLDVLSTDDIANFGNVSAKDLFNIADSLTEAYLKTKNNNASFDYILLSILKLIKNEGTEVHITEEVKNEIPAKTEDVKEATPVEETVIEDVTPVVEEEKPEEIESINHDDEPAKVEQPVPMKNDDAFERFETAVMDDDMFNLMRDDSANEQSEVKTDSLERENSEPKDDEDSTITSFNSMEHTVTPTVNQERTIDDSKELDDSTVQDDNEEMDQPVDETAVDVMTSNDAIDEEQEIIATNGTELFNKQANAIVSDKSDREISYLVTDIINVLLGVVELGSGEPRKIIQNKIDQLFVLNKDNEFEDIDLANEFMPLFKANVAAADDNEIVLKTESLSRASFLNKALTNQSFRDKLMNVLGKDYVIYAVNDNEWNDAKRTYATLKQQGSLPSYDEINYDTFYQENANKLKSEVDEKTSEALKNATQLFDIDDIKVSDK